MYSMVMSLFSLTSLATVLSDNYSVFMACGYTQHEVEKMAEEIKSLRNQLSAKEDAISKLTQVIENLRKLIFGKKSERFISSDADTRQLDIFGEHLIDNEIKQLEKATKQAEELITNTINAKKARTPRKDISLENLRVE